MIIGKGKKFVCWMVAESSLIFSLCFCLAEQSEMKSELSDLSSREVPNMIIDRDDRSPVSSPDKLPYRCVTFLDVICECGCGWEASGVVVENGHTVLTAAHCVYCTEHAAPAESIIIYCGYLNHHQYVCRYDEGWSIITGTTFEKKEYSFEDDWAVISLAQDVGEITGALEPVIRETNDESGKEESRVVGYSDGVLYEDYGSIQVMDETHYKYTMDQASGASGGPILNKDNQVTGIAIGYQIEDDGTAFNVGYRLTPEILQAIRGDYPDP